jgi:hypothetical protein
LRMSATDSWSSIVTLLIGPSAEVRRGHSSIGTIRPFNWPF